MVPNIEIKRLVNFVSGFSTKKNEVNYHEEICRAISEAHREWVDAQNFFENVIDTELVDHAIYKIEAAKTKYIYLLKLAKKNGIEV